MAVLPDAWLLVLDTLLDSPLAWRSPAEIAASLGRGSDETADLLCDLDVAGWLAVWEAEAGPLVTLSSLAAERLGVRLVEVGAAQTPRWARPGEPDPPAVRSKHVCFSERAASLEFVCDPASTPDRNAERSERARAHAGPNRAPSPKGPLVDEPPRPTILVGLGLSPWPAPGAGRDGPCPACGDMTLGPQMYCLYCDRWGLDLRTPAAPAPAAEKVARPRPPLAETERTACDRLEAERLRNRRKHRRRSRHSAKADGDRRKVSPQALPEPASLPQPPALDQPRPVVPLYAPPVGKPSARACR